MIKYEYLTIKCHPNLLEEKLNENGLFNWEFVTLVIEQQMIQHPPPSIHSFSTQQKPPEVITMYMLIFKRIKEEVKK